MKNFFARSTFVIVFSILSAISLEAFTPNVANAQSHACQGVEYVKRVHNIPLKIKVGNAKEMIDSLSKLGFWQVNKPEIGAIVVMQPSFPGVNPTYGHVGIVYNIYQDGTIRVISANQPGQKVSTSTECNNVTTAHYYTRVYNRDISFWVKVVTIEPNRHNNTSNLNYEL